MTVTEAQQHLIFHAGALDHERPELLLRNTGPALGLFMSRLLPRLGAEWHWLGKTARDGGKIVPAGFRPRTVDYLGERVDVIAVSHDAVFWLPASRPDGFPGGVQFDVLSSANWWDVPFIEDSGRAAVARVSGGIIDPADYRPYNPPIAADFSGGEPPVAQPPPQQPSAGVTFPPRDLAGAAFQALDDFYREGGRPNRGAVGAPLYIDNEGIFVWYAEYLRHYALIARPTLDARATHAEALRRALAGLEAEWPR